MTDEEVMRAAGGLPIYQGGETTWRFGWIPPSWREAGQVVASNAARDEMPPFVLDGPSRSNAVEQAALWELWGHPDVVRANGFPFTGGHQLTGSCVGCGGGNAIMSLACVEAVRRGEPELALVPFWLLPYGRSRFYLGDRGRGEGSTGATFAKAAREDGVVPANSPGLPPFTHDDGLVWGSSVELSWSDGDADQTTRLLPDSRKHLVRTTAQCQSADDVREALVHGFPCTCASNWGGLMACPTEGSPAVLLNRHAGSWSHQMSIHAWWDHPGLGEIFWIQNQWGLDAHGRDPSGGPPGGFWVKKAEVDWIVRNGEETFAFSQFQGFPAPDAGPLPWLF